MKNHGILQQVRRNLPRVVNLCAETFSDRFLDRFHHLHLKQPASTRASVRKQDFSLSAECPGCWEFGEWRKTLSSSGLKVTGDVEQVSRLYIS
ncbi:unnamed protein product [Pleuronectes platessa]|uniref:Uncharacterized protein n=1 Tax=Pleuronectes platessa TaxID=8262 RepID=A0A9N7US61_PLEPL|nr:unnamed protein product [Pleuronectes platessa]